MHCPAGVEGVAAALVLVRIEVVSVEDEDRTVAEEDCVKDEDRIVTDDAKDDEVAALVVELEPPLLAAPHTKFVCPI